MTTEPAVIVTFIRHGESLDNLRSVWAGWADAPLSDFGSEQARALGVSLRDIPFAHIHASDLKRAAMTAQALQAGQIAEPKPELTRTTLLREQHFGIAEGKPWTFQMTPGMTLEEHFEAGLFPVLGDTSAKFPEGESTDDLGQRAARAVKELIMPHVWATARAGERNVHVAVVSHGLCISQLVPALLDVGGPGPRENYAGLKNTAWTRAEVTLKTGRRGLPLEFSDSDPPPLTVKITQVNQYEHLQTVTKTTKKTPPVDPKQQDIRAFFGGAAAGSESKPPVLEHANSNANDEAEITQVRHSHI